MRLGRSGVWRRVEGGGWWRLVVEQGLVEVGGRRCRRGGHKELLASLGVDEETGGLGRTRESVAELEGHGRMGEGVVGGGGGGSGGGGGGGEQTPRLHRRGQRGHRLLGTLHRGLGKGRKMRGNGNGKRDGESRKGPGGKICKGQE